jgi:hypothetical protein
MLPKKVKQIIEIEILNQVKKKNDLDLKQKMIEQGLYSVEEINKIFSDYDFKDEINECFKLINLEGRDPFYEFYSQISFPPMGKGEELFTLDQILENYQSQNWLNLFPERVALKEKYPHAGERYLQITSIEGGGSYFYDKETDYVYDVDWGREEDMITGKLKPWFTSFYDFLEWYYSDEDA